MNRKSAIPSSDIKLQECVELFLHHLLTEKQLSLHSVNAYSRDLNKLIDDQGESTSPAKIDHLAIQQTTSKLHRQGQSSRSIQRWLSAVRSFFKYCLRQNWSNTNPANDIRAPKASKPLPKTVDVDEISQLLNFKGEDFLSTRNRAIFELLYSSGLRISELCSIDMYDIDLNAASVRVTGKGNKTRELPIGSKAIEALHAWLKVRADHLTLNSGQAMFISTRGTRVSPRSIQKKLKDHGINQGIDAPLSPHMLRHSFASHMLESSGDLRAVQELLGHANISTTQIYTHLDYQHLAKVYDKAHPRSTRKPTNDDID